MTKRERKDLIRGIALVAGEDTFEQGMSILFRLAGLPYRWDTLELTPTTIQEIARGLGPAAPPPGPDPRLPVPSKEERKS